MKWIGSYLPSSTAALVCWAAIVVATLFLSSPQPASAQHPVQELTETRSFPHDSTGIFLTYPTRIRHDAGEVFVLDFHANTILRFSADGTPLGTIGAPGQGPGEFQTSTDFLVHDDTVWVADAGNHRLQAFDREGHSLDVISWNTPGRGFVRAENEIIWQQGRSGFHSGEEEDNLFIRFDLDGREIEAFGSWIEFEPSLSFNVSNSFLDINKNRVYALSAYYPLLRIYSTSGVLLNTLTFEPLTDWYKERVPENYNWEALSERNSGIIWTKFLFRTIRVTDDGIFVGLFERSQMMIDQFSLQGEYLGRFIFDAPTDDGFYLHDFEIFSDESGNAHFMALLSGVSVRVSVLPFTPFTK